LRQQNAPVALKQLLLAHEIDAKMSASFITYLPALCYLAVKNNWLLSHPKAKEEVGGTFYGAGNSLIE
jgi:hypothetical protein